MSLYQKILLCNILRHKFSSYSYVLFCLLCFCYFVIYSRFNEDPTFNFQFQTFTTTKPSEPANLTNIPQELPMKYILLWTSATKFPFKYFGEGNSIFKNKSCQWTNCYVTGDRTFLGSHTEFDVIAFNGPQLPLMIYNRDWPGDRLPRQKYVFTNIESAVNSPFRTNVFNGFFNWTWTYKLNSDAVWGYIVVRDSSNKVIGPQEDMHWIKQHDMAPVDVKELTLKIKTKQKAVAWMCSSERSASRREEFVKTLQEHLKQYKMKVDIYGKCGDHQCPKEIMSRCLKIIQKRYYFYLAFENSFSDDYVTEKVFYALNYDTVPIVYGGANYSRFLPPGSYLDAVKLGPKKLAHTIFYLITSPLQYMEFFRWKKHYYIHPPHQSSETDTYCNFCAMVNNETLMNKRTNYEHFNAWWMHKVMKVL